MNFPLNPEAKEFKPSSFPTEVNHNNATFSGTPRASKQNINNQIGTELQVGSGEYKHPFESELSQFKPRPEWLIPDLMTPTIPPCVCHTRFYFIETAAELDWIINHLKTVGEMGVDLEYYGHQSNKGFTCLIQITTRAADIIVDAIQLRKHIHKLNVVFTNPNILKVFHGGNMDVLWLQKDFGVFIVGMFDTHIAAYLLDVHLKNLKSLLERYCDVYTNKSFQLADWRRRPLSLEMIHYARTDTHYLLYIARCMKAELLRKNNGKPDLLLKVFTLSQKVCSMVP